MEAWLLCFFLSDRPCMDFQNRTACSEVAKELTRAMLRPPELNVATCINTFDGTVLYFARGREVPNP